MMKCRNFLYGLIMMLAVGLTSGASATGQTKIGTFTDAEYPVYLIGYTLQASPDGNFMLFRGGNFQGHELVKTDEGVPDFSPWLLNHTDWGGMKLPDISALPEIQGWDICYCYDVPSNVTGYGLCKENISYQAYKDDPNLRLFKTAKAAKKEVRTIPDTDPIVIVPHEPEENGGDTNNHIGKVGYYYGSSYAALKAEMSGGVAEYDFYGQTGVNYPSVRNTKLAERQVVNGLATISLPSHSTTANAYLINARVPSKIEMSLYDDTGRLVWKLYDTKGGIHPGSTGIKMRGNNHPDDAHFYIKFGEYRLRVKNLNIPSSGFGLGSGTDDIDMSIRFEFLNSNEHVIDTKVGPGETRDFLLDMASLKNDWLGFKLNCNLY